MDFEFIGSGSGPVSRNDILLHAANHTTCHRGLVADMLYHLSFFPPTTDLPVFLKEIAKGAWRIIRQVQASPRIGQQS